MILKLLLKLWPSLLPITIYLIWVAVIKKIIIKFFINKIDNKRQKKSNKNIIEGEYEIIGEKTTVNNDFETKSLNDYFSFNNKAFVLVIYLSLIIAILSLIFFAI